MEMSVGKSLGTLQLQVRTSTFFPFREGFVVNPGANIFRETRKSIANGIYASTPKEHTNLKKRGWLGLLAIKMGGSL